jgi:hypothetical protein
VDTLKNAGNCTFEVYKLALTGLYIVLTGWVNMPPPNFTDKNNMTKSPKLLDQVREKLRTKHYAIRIQQSYVDWIKRYFYFRDKSHPKHVIKMGRTPLLELDLQSRLRLPPSFTSITESDPFTSSPRAHLVGLTLIIRRIIS